MVGQGDMQSVCVPYPAQRGSSVDWTHENCFVTCIGISRNFPEVSCLNELPAIVPQL